MRKSDRGDMHNYGRNILSLAVTLYVSILSFKSFFGGQDMIGYTAKIGM